MVLNKNYLESTSFLQDEQAIFNSVHNIVMAIDYQGRITIFNPTSERVFNIPAEKALGHLISEVLPGTGLLKVLKTGKPHIGRKFVAGNALWVVNRTPVIQNGAIVGAIGVAQEVTELQYLAEELEETNRIRGTLETIFDSARDGYLAINNEGRVILINEAMAGLLGVTVAEATGRHVTEIAPDTGLQLIPRNSKTQIGEVARINGRDTVVMRYPIYQQGKIAGAVSKVMFNDVEQLIALAGKLNALRREQGAQRKETERVPGARFQVNDIIGSCPSMSRLKETIRRVAQRPSTVLIRGESGTGKELVAHALHTVSPRRNGPFVKVNCAAVPENLLESELFGYQEGAFTGARKGGQTGKFEQANGGTIFLDEIGDMPLAMQAKLLRVLQDREIERLGDNRTRQVDVRVVAATNRDIEGLIRQGQFREDLYYRLNVISLHIPPLRERLPDLHGLAHHFIDKFNLEFGLSIRDLSPEVWSLLQEYNWPGNVRELENVIERAFNLVEGETIQTGHLPQYLLKLHREVRRPVADRTLPALLEEVEKEALIEALATSGGNKMQAARALGISRAWLYKKMKQYGIQL
ncbi:sigma-54 interaction domain-containing protein [Desulfotomaculum copahuensis]|uniref:Sigma-54-dependent Fis family transcriptional regulator n=1 Tax=Desulfotomaculum copahuensis TaxID=1838280 RepID=A0A1B7LH62_9FIRM|nr:sigma-54-dependent Fis family transcriptional regulator [Desulfotomaculum copahuensis]OAT85448.1 sigma-54-dependent Fis family transcriptional regulator [Desulfotomaculum copahuensis]